MRLAIFIVLIYALLSCFYNASLPLFVDEAYYWLWSLHLDSGYLDHPPAIAVGIWLFTIFGDAQWLVRLISVVCMSGAVLFIFALANEIFNKKIAFISLFLLLLSPLAGMGFSLATPDAPLTLFWAASLYFGYKALIFEKDGDFILTGICIGLALTSKYTAVLIPLIFFLFLLTKKPKLLLSLKPYGSLFIALLVFSPVILWNYQNEWISFTFQYNHGTTDETKIVWKNFWEFFGGQFILLSPIVFVILLFALSQIKIAYKNDKKWFLWLATTVVLGFFLYKGLYKKMELNWAAPALLSGAILASEALVRYNLKKTLFVCFGLGFAALVLVKFPLIFGLNGTKNPHSRIFGYKETVVEIQNLSRADDAIMSDHLTTASIFWYYLKQPVTIPTNSRISQFDRWNLGQKAPLKNGLYISKDDRSEELKNNFSKVELLELFKASKDGYTPREFYIYRVEK